MSAYSLQHVKFAQVVDALMEHKPGNEVDNYRYFDPKLLRAADRSVVI